MWLSISTWNHSDLSANLTAQEHLTKPSQAGFSILWILLLIPMEMPSVVLVGRLLANTAPPNASVKRKTILQALALLITSARLVHPFFR
jgi:hypothetical protein